MSAAEVAVTLELLYGVKTGIHLNKLAATAQSGGFPASDSLTKPIVGGIFTRESGGVVQRQCPRRPRSGPRSSLVGLERAIVLGKKSSKHSISAAVKRLGLNATDGRWTPLTRSELSTKVHAPSPTTSSKILGRLGRIIDPPGFAGRTSRHQPI
jgi:isopropylmalate/homocitrate/citramalate synthase